MAESDESVLSALLARNERLGKRTMLGRICLIGNVVNEQQRQILTWHKSVLPKLKAELAPDEVTGLLLLYPNHFLHVVEAELPVLSVLMQKLIPLAAAGTMTSDIRVLASSDDIPSRLFPSWSSSNVQQHSSGPTPADGGIAVPVPTRIADTYISMLKIGHALTNAKKSDRDSMLADLRTRYGDVLPTQELVSEVGRMEDALTIAEFADIFFKPIDTKLDREVVWPIETELVY